MRFALQMSTHFLFVSPRAMANIAEKNARPRRRNALRKFVGEEKMPWTTDALMSQRFQRIARFFIAFPTRHQVERSEFLSFLAPFIA